jgi:hypothetical protein
MTIRCRTYSPSAAGLGIRNQDVRSVTKKTQERERIRVEVRPRSLGARIPPPLLLANELVLPAKRAEYGVTRRRQGARGASAGIGGILGYEMVRQIIIISNKLIRQMPKGALGLWLYEPNKVIGI